jgi:hypothetical protein
MKKILVIFLLSFVTNFYGQTIIKNMENVKYNYVTIKPFIIYDSNKKNLDYLNYFKATDSKTSLLVFYMLSNDSIKIVNGGKTIKEDKFPSNSTSVRSIQPISNQKSLELLFFRENVTEKITITAEDLKKYKFIYVSPKQSPLEVEFTNIWKMFM